jgi:hypothetical protein
MDNFDTAPAEAAARPAVAAQERLARQLAELRRVLCDAAMARLERHGSDAARPVFGAGGPASSGWSLVDLAPVDDDARVLREVQRCESALERLSAGRYGRCVDCGDAIAAPALEARPETERCPACQAVFERGLFAPSRVS